MNHIEITKEEQAMIRSLRRLAKKWPNELTLFSFNGTLCICKQTDGPLALIETFNDIINDGGEPTDDELDQSPEISWL